MWVLSSISAIFGDGYSLAPSPQLSPTSPMKIRQIFTVIRWLAAIALFYTAYRRVTAGIPVAVDEAVGEVAVGIPGLLSGIGFMVGGVACIAPELIEWASIPFRIFFNAVFFPGTREIPPPDYNLTRVYREQERYEEALEAYFRILRHHPQELLAYIEGIETAFECGEPDTARKFLRMGLSDLSSQEVRDQVQRVFDACLSRPPAEEEGSEIPVEEEAPPAPESTLDR